MERPPVTSPQGVALATRAAASRGSGVDHRSGCRRARAVAASVGARHGGSVEVTARPTMSWQEITIHGDAMRI
ncbi:hypothetical protein B296_00003095 [Ensete ventricosum]|uniref:Uncharacterized protein n=1 Tax=Ensete ventricosum TaxID=4639 RepID=A0A426YEV8_ENSVE|nr:hypothetical protein B296_00003095 [Ensete ventricosum]